MGGVESYVAELNRELLAAGHADAITVIAPRLPHFAASSEALSPGYRVVRFPAAEPTANFPLPAVWRPALWRALREARARDHDLIVSHTRFFPSSLLALVWARITNRPLLHVEHGADYVQLQSRGPRALSRLYDRGRGRLVLRRADAVVGVSSAAAAFVTRLSGRTAAVIYRGAAPNLDAVLADPVLAKQARDVSVILYAGRLIDGKGVPDLIDALAALPAAALLCIVGDGPKRADLEAQATRLGVADRVSFRGYLPVTETLSLMRAADVVVSPSYTEGLPTAVLEAALLGRAIVASDVGGTGEIVRNEHSALLYPPRDVGALTAALARLLADPPLRDRLGRAARDDARERFSWEVSAREFAAVAQRVARSRSSATNVAS